MLLIFAVIGTGVLGSRFFPTEEMLQDHFALGQQYYAANDHANSVQIFSEIENTPNYALLDVDRIEVTIGELTLPIRVAATYQLGNSNRNVGQTLLARSHNAAAEGDSMLARRRLAQAEAAFAAGKTHYRQLVAAGDGVPPHLQAMASYQIVRASYQMGDYGAVVREAGELLASFPGSDYREAALYDAGWAHYHMGQYRQAIATFGQLIGDSTDVLRFDRALFQTGQSYYALGRYSEARVWYGRLVAKYDFASFSEKELQAMKTERLRGLVQETTRELVAKAQIRIADSHATERDLDAAIAAYSLVPERYPQEDLLVQKSFDNMAQMVFEQRGLAPGVAVLRQAIEQVVDPHFRGRVQLKIARSYYAAADYLQAIAEYAVYQKAYGEYAAAIGVSLDQVDFLIAEAHRLQAAQESDGRHLQRAKSGFERLLRQYPHSARRAEAHYGLGLTYYRLGDPVAARASFAAAVAVAPQAPVAPHALSWQARMAHAAGESATALGLYRRIVAQSPTSELVDQAWKDLAIVHKKMGALDQAIAALVRVGRQSPLWAKSQAEAGDMLLAAGR
ncbi:MAG: tetratricopeptide repeat protein, partial [Candidatus Latescibacteria bacterium]|nr:tetratricopeptide repeat protein [Candidatus Latescibacterota bacterium]